MHCCLCAPIRFAKQNKVANSQGRESIKSAISHDNNLQGSTIKSWFYFLIYFCSFYLSAYCSKLTASFRLCPVHTEKPVSLKASLTSQTINSVSQSFSHFSDYQQCLSKLLSLLRLSTVSLKASLTSQTINSVSQSFSHFSDYQQCLSKLLSLLRLSTVSLKASHFSDYQLAFAPTSLACETWVFNGRERERENCTHTHKPTWSHIFSWSFWNLPLPTLRLVFLKPPPSCFETGLSETFPFLSGSKWFPRLKPTFLWTSPFGWSF